PGLRAALVRELEKQYAANQDEEPVVATVVAGLIAEGAPIDAEGASGWTPLLCAIAGSEGELATQLLERGANPNVADKRGWTPLRFAIFGSHVDLVQQLLERKADPNAKDATGETPLMAAVWCFDPDDPTVRFSSGASAAEDLNSRSRIVDL